MSDETAIRVVAAADAVLGAADVTRRFAFAFPDGMVRLPGLTRPEGQRVADALAALPPALWDDALVEVGLPVLLSDGAGPHLVDAQGRLVLAVAAHPALVDQRVAMGADMVVGVVRPAGPGAWVWSARAAVSAERRIAALDELDAVRSPGDLDDWQSRNQPVPGT
jgi:hypothetical protein